MAEHLRILIVDDNPDDRALAARALLHDFPACEITEVANPTELDRAIEAGNFDAVVTDYQLRWSDGLTVLRRLLERYPELPVVMFTNTGSEEICAEAMKSGLSDYIIKKPRHYARLPISVRQALDRRDMQEQLSVQLRREAMARARAEDAERRFRTMGETVPFGVWECDAQGNATYFSRSLSNLVEQPASALLDRGWLDFVIEEEREEVTEHWRQCVEGGTRWNEELHVRSADGNVRTLLSRAHPVHAPDGMLTGWAGINLDITKRTMLERERAGLLERERKARKEAELANQLKDEFLAAVSHELRTPLNAMVGWADVLSMTELESARARKAVDAIRRNVRVQTQLINDLLDLSRIVSGRLRLDVQSVDPERMVHNAVELVRPTSMKKDIQLKLVLSNVGAVVRGDPRRLEQIVWNLLDNAIKFTPRGGRIAIYLERVNSQVEISIQDNGQGIDPELLPYIFDRFRQGEGGTTRREGGLGIGLSLVKQLVDLQGGSVRAKSPGIDQGTTFVVCFPLASVASGRVAAHDDDDDDQRERPDPSISLSGLDVVVVDDDLDAAELVQMNLQDAGAVVRVAHSVREAVDHIDERTPDLVVSDVGMPGEDGYTLARRLRSTEATRDVPAIALTAYASTKDRQRALLAGFQTHIAKPVEPLELLTVVASVTRRIAPPQE